MTSETKMNPKFKLMLEDEFDFDAEELFSLFWNPESKMWQEVMVLNEMTDFKNKDESETGKTSSFVVKMSAPVGPKTADVIMTHKYQKTEKSGKKLIINEIEHKTLNFPYADYFDIIHR